MQTIKIKDLTLYNKKALASVKKEFDMEKFEDYVRIDENYNISELISQHDTISEIGFLEETKSYPFMQKLENWPVIVEEVRGKYHIIDGKWRLFTYMSKNRENCTIIVMLPKKSIDKTEHKWR